MSELHITEWPSGGGLSLGATYGTGVSSSGRFFGPGMLRRDGYHLGALVRADASAHREITVAPVRIEALPGAPAGGPYLTTVSELLGDTRPIGHGAKPAMLRGQFSRTPAQLLAGYKAGEGALDLSDYGADWDEDVRGPMLAARAFLQGFKMTLDASGRADRFTSALKAEVGYAIGFFTDIDNTIGDMRDYAYYSRQGSRRRYDASDAAKASMGRAQAWASGALDKILDFGVGDLNVENIVKALYGAYVGGATLSSLSAAATAAISGHIGAAVGGIEAAASAAASAAVAVLPALGIALAAYAVVGAVTMAIDTWFGPGWTGSTLHFPLYRTANLKFTPRDADAYVMLLVQSMDRWEKRFSTVIYAALRPPPPPPPPLIMHVSTGSKQGGNLPAAPPPPIMLPPETEEGSAVVPPEIEEELAIEELTAPMSKKTKVVIGVGAAAALAIGIALTLK